MPLHNDLRLHPPAPERLSCYIPSSGTTSHRGPSSDFTQSAQGPAPSQMQWDHYNRSAGAPNSAPPLPPPRLQLNSRQNSAPSFPVPEVERDGVMYALDIPLPAQIAHVPGPGNTGPVAQSEDMSFAPARRLRAPSKPPAGTTHGGPSHNVVPYAVYGSNQQPPNGSYYHPPNQNHTARSAAALPLQEQLNHNIAASGHPGRNDYQQHHSQMLQPIPKYPPQIHPPPHSQAPHQVAPNSLAASQFDLSIRTSQQLPPQVSFSRAVPPVPAWAEPGSGPVPSAPKLRRASQTNDSTNEIDDGLLDRPNRLVKDASDSSKAYGHPQRDDREGTTISLGGFKNRSGAQDPRTRTTRSGLASDIPGFETSPPYQSRSRSLDQNGTSTQLVLQHMPLAIKYSNVSPAVPTYGRLRRRLSEEVESTPFSGSRPTTSSAPTVRRAEFKDRSTYSRVPPPLRGVPLSLAPMASAFEEVGDSREMSLSEWMNSGQGEQGKASMDVLLDQLAGILESSSKRKALQGLTGDHAQALIDFLYRMLLWQQTSSRPLRLRERVLVTLRRLSGASTLYPRWYVLNGIARQSLEDSGGFCDIYKGRFRGLELCLKAIRVPQHLQPDRMLKIYAKEAILWGQLHHSNITPFYGIFYHDDTRNRMCLVSPWMSNGNIVSYLKRNPTIPRKPFVYDISKGLKYLHSEQIIHADLKGVNVLVNDYGMACITDFGISTIQTDSTTGGANGRSTRWIPPELLAEGATPTRESDIWALGCVFYEILTRKLPFGECGTDAQVIFKLGKIEPPARKSDSFGSNTLDGVDDAMWALMNWCWATDSDKRPTCNEVLQLLEQQGPTADTRLDMEDRGRSWRESQDLQAMLGGNSDAEIDIVKVREILTYIHSTATHGVDRPLVDGGRLGAEPHTRPSGRFHQPNVTEFV